MIAATPFAADARVAILANLIAEELTGTGEGHCVRVDYLDRAEALAVCRYLKDRQDEIQPRLSAYVLGSAGEPAGDDLILTTDRAIELRNRKRDRLCVLVPADLVDATISSLGNAFARLDGRELHKRALEGVVAELPPEPREMMRRVQAQLVGAARTSGDDLLDFALAVAERHESGRLDTAGLDLWRVGLIADARPDFEHRLAANKRSARILVRPQRIDAPFRDRIASLKLAPETARELERFFARRPLHDVRRWSRALAAGDGPTFDAWVFPETVETDLESLRVLPFTDARGAVLKTAKLLQPDGPSGSLLAPCGPKEAIAVRWETTPLKAVNVSAWQVSLVPARGDGEAEDDASLFDLPSREVKGSGRTARLKLDIEFDEPPEESFCVRVVALDETGNELLDGKGNPIAAVSDEFFLTHERHEPAAGVGQRRRTVSSLAEGRLRAAVEGNDTEITLTQPGWAEARGVTYFTARANERTILNIALSPLLRDLEKRTLDQPRLGGRWSLTVDEVAPATLEQIEAAPLISCEDGAWADFWRARSTFCERVRRTATLDVIEAAEWTPELINAALRYGQAYAALLASHPPQLHDALSIDTLLVRSDRGDGVESAAVVLPTHPLRAVWFAAHAALLRTWEERVLATRGAQRRRMVDLDLVRDLLPTNMPAFAHDWAGGEPFVFFRSLGFFHGVALPAAVPDPLRRYHDVAQILGFGVEPVEADSRQPERLVHHLERFLALHPYADPLQIALVNPDRGEFIAETLDRLLTPDAPPEGEDGEARPTPAVAIAAYLLEGQQATLSGLDRLRARQHERSTRHAADHLRPALATSVRPFADLAAADGASAHVAVVSDLSRPGLVPLPAAAPEGTPGSLSLFGLISRFVSSFEVGESGARWSYRVLPASPTKLEAHPAGPRFGDTLVELQTAILRASGAALNPQPLSPPAPLSQRLGEGGWGGEGGSVPGLAVHLDRDRVRVLDRLHAETDWVVTLDRFFGVDYYDSPHDDALGAVARKYLIDYSPEFTEGLGHRMIVTTAWRDEVAAILRRAMDDLGFDASDGSVGRLLHLLKTASGRLALQALSPDASSAAAVSLGAVMAWLQAKRRLSQAVLVPVDAHPDLFAPSARATAASGPGQHHCDLVLVGLRRGIVEASFIEVRWRRGPLGPLDDLVQNMDARMQLTGHAVADRYFDPRRADGALQRAYFANVLRFYAARARRYGLLDPGTAAKFLAHLAQFEKEGLELKTSFEGFIVSLEDGGRHPFVHDNLKITTLTAADFERAAVELVAAPRAPLAAAPAPSPAAAVEFPAGVSAAAEPTAAVVDVSPSPAAANGHSAPEPPVLAAAPAAAPPDPEPAAIPTDAGIDVPARTDLEVVLGEGSGGDIVWRPSVQGSPHLFITGIPGQGKSWTTTRLLLELSRQQVPALVFDFHGQFGDPAGRFVQTAGPRVLDAAEGLPFSPFECTAESTTATGWKQTAFTIADIFDYVCGLGDMQRDTLFRCIRDTYESCGFGKGAADGVPTEFPTLQDVLRRIELEEQQKRTRNLAARCRPLLEMDLFQPPAGTESTFGDSLRQGLVIDLHRLASETLQTAAGAFLLRKVYRDMFQWGEADRLRLAIVLDEAHRLAKDVTLPKIMKEGRKFGVAVVAASQGLDDFHRDVVSNAGTKIAFRANHPESRQISRFFKTRAGYDLVSALERLGVGTALVQTPDMPLAVRTRMR